MLVEMEKERCQIIAHQEKLRDTATTWVKELYFK